MTPTVDPTASPTTGPSAWHADASVMVGAVAGILLAAAGLLIGRPQVVALATPLILSAVWSLARRPRGLLTLTAAAETTAVRSARLDVHLTLTAPVGADVAVIRALSPGNPPVQVMVAVPDGARTLRLSTPSVRTGTRELFTVDALGLAGCGGWNQGPVHLPPARVLVLPRQGHLDLVPVSQQLRGLTGPHSSRRLGDGPEMRDVAPLRSGDSLRRVDWRATARRSPDLDQLYVRRTFAPSEATVVLVVDSRDDVGPQVATWVGYQESAPHEQTSLDLAREAAAAIAKAVVDAGDRVGLDDLGRLASPLPVASGKRHLQRVTYALALSRAVGTPPIRRRAPQFPSGALVYLFSTFLDDNAADIVGQWRSHGHRVIAVDTLPTADLRGLTVRETYAWRLTDIERHDRLLALARSGVDVLRWAGADAARDLRGAARAQGRPR